MILLDEFLLFCPDGHFKFPQAGRLNYQSFGLTGSDAVNKRFTLNVKKDRLEKAPGFDSGSWPNMADQTWAKGIHDYYGTKPYSVIAST